MAADGPSWADQWGEGGIGVIGGDAGAKSNKDDQDKKKEANSGGLGKAKAVAHKVKNNTSMGIKWIKNKCQKKTSST
ncbi:hypothetical protein ACS0TY_032786 [Phlomoides rotata]